MARCPRLIGQRDAAYSIPLDKRIVESKTSQDRYSPGDESRGLRVPDTGTAYWAAGLAVRVIRPGSRGLRCILGHGYSKTARIKIFNIQFRVTEAQEKKEKGEEEWKI